MTEVMSKKDYMLESIFWAVVVSLIYDNTLFRPILSMSLATSRIILWLITSIAIVLDIHYSNPNKRTLIQIILNMLCIDGTYAAITYWNEEKTLVLVLLTPAFLMFAIFTYFVIKSTSKHKTKKAAFGLKQIFTITMAVILMLIYLNSLLGNPVFNNKALPQKSMRVSDENDEWTIKNNIEKLKLFDDVDWVNLNASERIDLLQTVANIENRYLGISKELTVKVRYTLDENDYISGYLDEKGLISINSYYLDNYSGYEMLESILHECYHAYQHELIKVYNSSENKDLIVFEDVPTYIDEFSNYKNDEGYSSQLCEKNARKYAEYGVEDYKKKISYYLNKKES